MSMFVEGPLEKYLIKLIQGRNLQPQQGELVHTKKLGDVFIYRTPTDRFTNVPMRVERYYLTVLNGHYTGAFYRVEYYIHPNQKKGRWSVEQDHDVRPERFTEHMFYTEW